MPAPARSFTAGRLAVEVHPTRDDLGRAAAAAVSRHLRGVIASQGAARVVLACAPSQDEFLSELVDGERNPVDWASVTVFHMDEYVGIAPDHPRSFRRYLRDHFLDHVSVGAFHPIAGEAADSAAECARYSELLAARPIELICLGIGENGHIAFNDPPVADFDDPVRVKMVRLDDACRQQQVNDGCFPSLSAVPSHALTLTVPVFRHARKLSIHVPGARKAAAVRAALEGPIGTACPASVLRLHPSATLYLDQAAAGGLHPCAPPARPVWRR